MFIKFINNIFPPFSFNIQFESFILVNYLGITIEKNLSSYPICQRKLEIMPFLLRP